MIAAAILLTLPASALAQTSPGPAKVGVLLGAPYRPVPPAFLGLSIEYNELPNYDQWRGSFLRFLAKLHPSDTRAETILRIGGESADSTYWGSDPWAVVAPPYRQERHYEVTDSWMKQLGSLVRAAKVKVILDLNLAAHSPQMAGEEVAAARRDLPAGSLKWLEVGNEPDNYVHAYVGFSRAVRGGAQDWAFSFTIGDYTQLFSDYEQAIAGVAPRMTFAGPSQATRDPHWVSSLIASPGGSRVSLVTAHAYPPLRSCLPPTDGHYPVAADYLHNSLTNYVINSLREILAASRAASLPIRLTEVGASTCGGVVGATDTMATALWAPDYLFSLMAAGVDGLNFHTRGNGYTNAALLYTPSGLYAEPMFYGLALFARALGPEAQLMQVEEVGAPGRLKAWAIRVKGGGLRVLYLNKSFHDATVSLRLAAHHVARLQRLTAPSFTANDTVKLAGQRLGSDGRWHGPRVTRPVPNRNGTYSVSVPAVSAALLTIPPP